MKKYICDLSYNDMKTLLENNQSLYEKVFDYGMNTAKFWIDEYLYKCPADYRLGTYCQGEYFTLDSDNLDQCKKWFDSVQNAFCLINQEHEYLINLYFMTGNENIADEVNDIFYKRLIAEYDSMLNIDTLADIALMDSILDNECYTDESLTNVYIDYPETIIPEHTEILY